MARSAEPKITIDERACERERMERRLLIAWNEQQQEAKEKSSPFFGGRALYLLRQRLGNKPPHFRLVMERWLRKVRANLLEQEQEQRRMDLGLIMLLSSEEARCRRYNGQFANKQELRELGQRYPPMQLAFFVMRLLQSQRKIMVQTIKANIRDKNVRLFDSHQAIQNSLMLSKIVGRWRHLWHSRTEAKPRLKRAFRAFKIRTYCSACVCVQKNQTKDKTQQSALSSNQPDDCPDLEESSSDESDEGCKVSSANGYECSESDQFSECDLPDLVESSADEFNLAGDASSTNDEVDEWSESESISDSDCAPDLTLSDDDSDSDSSIKKSRICVKLPDSKHILFSLHPLATVSTLKKKIAERSWFAACQMRLRHASNDMQDDKTLQACGIVPAGQTIYRVDVFLRLLGGTRQAISKDAFVQLVLKRTAPPDLNDRLRFAAAPRSAAKLDENVFFDALILHALQTGQFDVAIVPSILSETDLDVCAAIQLLAVQYNSIGAEFHEEDVHPKMLSFSDSFRLQAKFFFQKNHPLFWQNMECWLKYLRKPVLEARRQADKKLKESMASDQLLKMAEAKRQAVKRRKANTDSEKCKEIAKAHKQAEANRRVNMSPDKRKEVAKSDRQAQAKRRADMSPEKRKDVTESKRRAEAKRWANTTPEKRKQAAQAQRNRTARKRREQTLPTSTDDLDRTELPEPNWFHNAKLDAVKTLLLFSINSGHAYFPALHEGRLPHSSECPAIMKEMWEDDDEVPEDVRKLLEKIREQVVTVEELDGIVKDFRKRIKLDGFYPACCSCGIRDRFISEEDMVKKRKAPVSKGVKPDYFAVKPEPPPYMRVPLDDPLFKAFELTEEQKRERAASGYPQVFSAYENRRTGAIYHLHPHLVDESAADGAVNAILCSACIQYAKRKARMDPSKPERKGPDHYCIATGYDYGRIPMLEPERSGSCSLPAAGPAPQFPQLSQLEKILIARYVPYGSLVKLSAWRGVRQQAIKGHVVTFGHTGPSVLADLISDLNDDRIGAFPWHGDRILDYIKISFVGPSGEAERCLRALGLDGGLLRADYEALLPWFRLLKALHFGYYNLVVSESVAEKQATQVKLDKIKADILAGAQIVKSKVARRMEEKTGADVAGVRNIPEDHDLEADDADLQELSDLDSSSESDADGASAANNMVDVDDPHFAEKLNIVLLDSMIINGIEGADDNPASVLRDLLAFMTRNPDTGSNKQLPDMFVRSMRDKEPINEFGNTEILHYLAFPCEFPLGKGLPAGSSALPPKIVRHVLVQESLRHAQQQNFYFTQFDQMHRHTASRVVSFRIKNSKPAIQEFISLVNEKGIIERLEAATQNPDSDDAKLLARQVMPLIAGLGATIPYSPSERKSMFPRFVGSMYRFGGGCIFASGSFDDVNHTFAIRGSKASVSNTAFPAMDHGFRAQFESRAEMYTEEGGDLFNFKMPITNLYLLQLVSRNPVAATQFFKTLFEAFLYILLRVPPPSQANTVPLHHSSRRGVFGIVTDISAVIETNARVRFVLSWSIYPCPKIVSITCLSLL